jgi:hypothetical protein
MGKLPTRTYRPIYLEDWMKVLGRKPIDLAKPHTSVTASYISNLCGTARVNPSALVMLEISETLGITVNDLYKKPPTAGMVETFSSYSPAAQQALLGAQQRK